MNTSRTFNVEYFKNKFAKHDAIVKEIIEDHIIPKISSRKKRDYKEAFTQSFYKDERDPANR